MIAVNDMLGFEIAGVGMFWQKQLETAIESSSCPLRRCSCSPPAAGCAAVRMNMRKYVY